MYLIGNGRLITRDADAPYIENGCVAVEGERILGVGATADMKEIYSEAKFIDAKGGVIMPGLINTHTHIYSALARGLSMPNYNPRCFYEVLDGMWWKLDRKLTLNACIMSAYATVIECIKNGVTTIFDHHASYFDPRGVLLSTASVANELGIRACLCYETSEREGNFKCVDAIVENLEFIDYCEARQPSLIRAMFGMHASFTLGDSVIKECVALNGGRTGFHIHVSESLDDVYDAMHKYKKTPVQRLFDLGVLGNKTILAHCVHVSPSEMDLIKATSTMVVNNPASNMSNAVGCAPVLELYKHGITLGLGSDAYTNDMLESAKAALAIQRHNAGMPNVAWDEAVSMLINGNRLIASRYYGEELGVIKSGAAADIVIMDYTPYTPFNADAVDGHMLFGMSGSNCSATMIAGKLLYYDRKLQYVDESAIYASVRQAATALWQSL